MTGPRVSRRLALTDLFSLARLENEDADAAADLRHRSFHEAGHTWGEVQVGPSRRTPELAQVAADGVLAQAVMIETDRNPSAGVPATLAAVAVCDAYDGYVFWERAVALMDAQRRDPWCCLRGGDEAGHPLLADEEWVASRVPVMLSSWGEIVTIARSQVEG